MSRSPGTIRASYKKFDRYLARNYPRLRVLHLPATILFSLIMSNIAALHGQLTPGTPGNLNNTSGITAIWFLVCCLVAMCWLVLQWRERSDLPAGCKAKFAWSTIPNALCLALIFLPVTI